MAKVELKKPVVEEIAANVKDAESVVLVAYSGIDVASDTQLRKELREAGVTYKVYKNTMMNFAFKDTEFEPLCKHLEGPNAIAISKTDATAAARILSKYAKKIPALKLIAGVVEGKYCDEKAVAELADIPSREILLGRLLGSMQSPVANFARVIKQIAEKDAPAADTTAEA
jgi:large subunit ribosomal protein L10